MILRGARQVGKTHLLQEFAATCYSKSLYLNFEKDKQLETLFKQSLEPEKIIKNLNLYFGESISPQEHLLIFDEIQECPDALNSLKYFNESKKNFHIIAAGSLLGVKLSEKGFPVGQVDFLDIYPLTFLEFLEAIGKKNLADHLKEMTSAEAILQPIHNIVVGLLKDYFFVGGMPEVVYHFAEHPTEYQKIRHLQQTILDAYRLDFAKHAPKEQVVRISEVFDIIPTQLGKENKKFTFSAIAKSARAREYSTALQWLKDTRILHQVKNISDISIPLLAHAHQDVFKVYLLDVGLLGALYQTPTQLLVEEDKIFSSFKGALTENFVAQELIANGHSPLFYWSSDGKAEVDFILQHHIDILPLEVKSGTNVRSKSLSLFGERYKKEKLTRTSLLNFEKNAKITNYPLYTLSCFPKLS